MSDVIQKALIEANEEGSEAAAATALMGRAAWVVPILEFRCEKPFLFFIKDGLSGLILFAGALNKPKKA